MLPGLSRTRLGLVVGALTLLAVLSSRLLFLPDGPWEQDEALFAAGVVDFDITRHRPHPPGFPGWIALGKIARPLFGDAVLALQVVSSLASVALFWALAWLLDRLTPGGRATALALAFTMSPLAWVHAGRAFSTTPALACAALAVLAWLSARQQSAWFLLALAAAIRPQLIPECSVLAAFGLAHGDRRSTLHGAAIVLGVAGACAVTLALSSGGWQPMTLAFEDHFGRHRGGLNRNLAFEELGFVRGLGHPIVAATVLLLALVGLLRALRRQRHHGLWLLVLIATTGWMLLRFHHPGFPRYTVSLLVVLMPAVAWALDAARHRGITIALWSAVVVSVVAGLDPVLAMRGRTLPVVAATRQVVRDPDARALVYSHGQFSFARLLGERAGLPLHDQRSIDTLPTLGPRSYALAGSTVRFLDGVTACTVEPTPAPARAMALGQARFDRARLGRDVVLLGKGVHAPEFDANGERYAWLSQHAQLMAPVGAHAIHLQLDVPEDMAGAQLHVGAWQFVHEGVLRPGPQSVVLRTRGCPQGCLTNVAIMGARHEASGDTRELTVRLEGAWVEGPDYTPAYARWSPGSPRSLRAHDVQLHGFEPPEQFRERRGAWTGPTATASFPAGPGIVRLHLARPQHTPGPVTLASGAEAKALDVGSTVTTVDLRTAPTDGRAQLSFTSPTFVPAQVRPGTHDARNLGLIVYAVEFFPEHDPCRPDDVSSSAGGTR